jgi:Zn finger protein HypA/HybF involved in hydrogenase expression
MSRLCYSQRMSAAHERAAALKLADAERERLAKEGYWLCLKCEAPCDVENQGEHNQRCAKCKTQHVQWIPPKEIPNKAPHVPKPAQPQERLPYLMESTRPVPAHFSLTEACTKGFHICRACGQIVQVSALGHCRNCGSSDVHFEKPVMGESKAEHENRNKSTGS